jgi:hypothetical protein
MGAAQPKSGVYYPKERGGGFFVPINSFFFLHSTFNLSGGHRLLHFFQTPL